MATKIVGSAQSMSLGQQNNVEAPKNQDCIQQLKELARKCQAAKEAYQKAIMARAGETAKIGPFYTDGREDDAQAAESNAKEAQATADRVRSDFEDYRDQYKDHLLKFFPIKQCKENEGFRGFCAKDGVKMSQATLKSLVKGESLKDEELEAALIK